MKADAAISVPVQTEEEGHREAHQSKVLGGISGAAFEATEGDGPKVELFLGMRGSLPQGTDLLQWPGATPTITPQLSSQLLQSLWSAGPLHLGEASGLNLALNDTPYRALTESAVTP